MIDSSYSGRRVACVALALLLGACGGAPVVDGEPSPDPAALGLTEGTPEALGVLALLNDPATTEACLDVDARLDSRAAHNLVAHRDGPDAKPGTADDDLFDDIAEVDGVKWVGTAALKLLAAFATQEGYVKPAGGGVSPSGAGSYEGVYFSARQVALTIQLANTASVATLDDDVSLDSRAASGIVATRPLSGLDQLAAVSYVGATALRLMRDYADLYLDLPVCSPASPCLTGLKCVGVPAVGQAVGRCVDTAVLPGQGSSCTMNASCGVGLVCAGLTLGAAPGQCLPGWMAREFTDESTSGIPDGVSGASSSVLAFGLASVPVDVTVRLDIEHPRPADLLISLTDPNGQVVIVWNRQAGSGPDVVGRFVAKGISGDDQVNGEWLLTVSDQVKGESGTLRGWSLDLTSRWD